MTKLADDLTDDPTTRAVISRRGLLVAAGLSAAGAAGMALLPTSARAAGSTATTTSASCSADSAEQEVGPFYVADGLVRFDITESKDGVALALTITLTDSTSCGPLVGAAVDVWQADALGVYSDEASENTTGETYLRGVQITDNAGRVTFTTIVPGWYSGRTMHIHLRVYTGGSVSGMTYSYSSATLVHTGQMFFDPDTSTAIAATAPYTSNPNSPRTVNSDDRVYTEQNGDESLITTSGSISAGYIGTIGVTVTGGGTTSAAPTTLTMASRAKEVKVGTKLTLSGTLTDTTTTKPLGDQDVVVTATLPGGTSHSTVVETADDGSWACTLTPTVTSTYAASYVGSTAYAASSSSSLTVPVVYRVVITSASSKAPARVPVAVAGTVTPARKGVVVSLISVSSTGKMHKVASASTDAKGRWSARWHASKGRYRIVAHVPSDTHDRAASSRDVVVERT